MSFINKFGKVLMKEDVLVFFHKGEVMIFLKYNHSKQA